MRKIKILKPVQSYTIGKVYRLSPKFAAKLISRGQAEEVLKVKEAKVVIETKEEKFTPETKEPLSISKLKKVISDISVEELIHIANFDKRVTAVLMAKSELIKR